VKWNVVFGKHSKETFQLLNIRFAFQIKVLLPKMAWIILLLF